jgi:hypothetical protein
MGPRCCLGTAWPTSRSAWKLWFDGAGSLEIIRRARHTVVSVALPHKHVLA